MDAKQNETLEELFIQQRSLRNLGARYESGSREGRALMVALAALMQAIEVIKDN
jgi:hypothetical protein